MKLGRPHIWIGLFSAMGVAFVAVVGVERTSPGVLSTVHQREPDLSGGRSCSQCHGGWRQSMASACLECHGTIASQIDELEGLHGAMGSERAQSCATCHSEHHGRGFQTVNRQSFIQAGVPDRDQFEHPLVGFEMEGEHLELDCTECHENADEEVLPKGEQRFGGLEQDCAQCHEDPHQGQMQNSCVECHGQTAFDQLGSLGHEHHLALVGGHAELSCRECHAQGEPYSLETSGSLRRPPARECSDCHDSPHAQEFISGVAAFAGRTPAASCVDCHEPEHSGFLEEGLTMSPAQHQFSGFRLNLPHDQAACEDCHAAGQGDFEARYPGRDGDTCGLCHEDPHQGQFDGLAFAADGCIACHERQHFEPHAYTIESHALAALPLTGTHVETECNACHQLPARDAARVFRGTPTTCESCHSDAHQGFFDEFSEQLAGNEAGQCATCHLTTHFADIPAGAFEHDSWTHFPLKGAHAQSDCESCHPRSSEADDFARSFGRVEQHFGKYEGCSTCHEDPHGGDFDGPKSPVSVEGRRTCARCHVQTSFRAFPQGFAHKAWTGFPLGGVHGEIECSACHAPVRAGQPEARSIGRAQGSACADCHADPHAGQFREQGRTDCSRCHKNTARFSTLVFDHDRDARFALAEQHASLDCSSCHKAWVREDESEVIQYRPLGTECTDCHGVHDDPLRRHRARRK